MPEERKDNEIVLPIGTYAYVLNTNNGAVDIACGPKKLTLQNTDDPVVYDPATVRKFRTVPTREAAQAYEVVPTGSYAVLRNPTKEKADRKFPEYGKQVSLQPDDLDVGKQVNIPGPVSFALWPSQEVKVVPGHQLMSNEYLLIRVYDEIEAKKNWSKSTVKPATPTDGQIAPSHSASSTEGQPSAEGQPASQAPPPSPAVAPVFALGIDPEKLVIGQLELIKGTDVSFYIPPTGVEVLPDENGSYVRQALTLERLEYCLLVDQDGSKRYVKGPAVVFPKPTETFKTNEDGNKKNRAYELNPISGLHIKVISDYVDEMPEDEVLVVSDWEAAGFHVEEKAGRFYVSNREGEELFITGKVMAIYFPRVEHAILTYAQQKRSRYHGVAVPAGEARYVMNRITGEIRTVKGYTVLLPDPRYEVIVQRVLSDNECRRYYPGNQKVIEYNRMLRDNSSDSEMVAAVNLSSSNIAGYSNVGGASFRTGHVDIGPGTGGAEGMVSYSADIGDTHTLSAKSLYSQAPSDVRKFLDAPQVQQFLARAMPEPEVTRGVSSQSKGLRSRQADVISRSSTFTPPRSFVLDPKFEGAPKVSPWTGYAIQIVNAEGERQVVIGPKTINLEFDQRLEALYLSTGTPKQHDPDKLMETSYLRLVNVISDEMDLVTGNLVPMRIRLKFLVRFDEASSEKWFNVDNPIQLLVDHFRSVIGNEVRQVSVGDFYLNATKLLKTWVLGDDGKGYTFEENGMTVYNINLVRVEIADQDIATRMKKAQTDELIAGFERKTLATDRDMTIFREETVRLKAEQTQITNLHRLEQQKLLSAESHSNELVLLEQVHIRDMKKANDEQVVEVIKLETAKTATSIELQEWELERQKDIHSLDVRIKQLMGEAAASAERARAIQPHLVEALTSLASTGAFELAARHLGNYAVLRDMSLGGAISTLFEGTELQRGIENLQRLGKGKLLQENKS